jgi:hypothetical protein
MNSAIKVDFKKHLIESLYKMKKNNHINHDKDITRPQLSIINKSEMRFYKNITERQIQSSLHQYHKKSNVITFLSFKTHQTIIQGPILLIQDKGII